MEIKSVHSHSQHLIAKFLKNPLLVLLKEKLVKMELHAELVKWVKKKNTKDAMLMLQVIGIAVVLDPKNWVTTSKISAEMVWSQLKKPLDSPEVASNTHTNAVHSSSWPLLGPFSPPHS